MEILLTRKTRTQDSTIGELSINDKFICYTLEDIDRGLLDTMPLSEIQSKKVHSKTAIPAGRYEVVITMSNRFKIELPLLLNVKGFEGIRIHAGNTSENTEGCLLLGKTCSKNFIGESRKAMLEFMPILRNFLRKEKVFITIK